MIYVLALVWLGITWFVFKIITAPSGEETENGYRDTEDDDTDF